MATQPNERYYNPAMPKSRRTPPLADNQSGGIFPTGQGGRTVLPPLSSAFPTSHFPVPVTYSSPYSQPRSSPARYDYNPTVYNQWPAGVPNPTTPTPGFQYYETHDNRYGTTQGYPSYSSRTPGPPEGSSDSRRLPPLSTGQSYGREERWTPSYTIAPSHTPHSHIRSPTATYPPQYPSYNTVPHYGYSVPHAQMATMSHHSHSTLAGAVTEPRSNSPYRHPAPTSITPPPISPTSPDEPAVKKKRKRADAAQLKLLMETYNRTAFPTTEERLELARMLDMTPRSVQIWFQNRRQSMRQTRQSGGPSHQPFSLTRQDSMTEDTGSPETRYESSYLSDTSEMMSSHRRARSQDWSRPQ